MRLLLVAHSVIIDEVGFAQHVEIAASDLAEHDSARGRRDQRPEPFAGDRLDHRRSKELHFLGSSGVDIR